MHERVRITFTDIAEIIKHYLHLKIISPMIQRCKEETKTKNGPPDKITGRKSEKITFYYLVQKKSQGILFIK